MHENIMNPMALSDPSYQYNHNVGLLLGIDPDRSYGNTMADFNKIGEYSIHKNAFIGLSHRFPNTSGGEAGKFRFTNNYVYGFQGDGTGQRLARVSGFASNDFVNNVYQQSNYSPDFTTRNLYGYLNNETPGNIDSMGSFYVDGNLFLNNDNTVHPITSVIQANGRMILHDRQGGSNSGNTGLNLDETNSILRDEEIPANSYPVQKLAASQVKNNVLANVGGNIRFNADGTAFVDDEIDLFYLDWAKNNTDPAYFTTEIGDGGIGDSGRFQYPAYSTANAVNLDIYDTDRDGIPNTWELAHNLDPEDPNNNTIRADRNWNIGHYLVKNNAGYTDLEMYLADIGGDFHMLANRSSQQ
ncbi:MAG TPA: hypothetical protein EYP18_10815 [Desulfobacterales bacterium]|nr:hypothetical protein [Desulfobacterales bacterium]